MLSGETNHNLDAKGRLILPVKFREELGSKFILTKGFEGCLAIYPLDKWEEFSGRLNALPSSSKEVRRLRRHFIGSSDEIEPDKQGRFLIKQTLRDFAGIDKNVTVIGMIDYIEIWSTERYYDYENSEEDSIEDIAENLIF